MPDKPSPLSPEGSEFAQVYMKLGQHDQRLDGHDTSILTLETGFREMTVTVKTIQDHLTAQDKKAEERQLQVNRKLEPLVEMAANYVSLEATVKNLEQKVNTIGLMVTQFVSLEDHRRESQLRMEERITELKHAVTSGLANLQSKIILPVILPLLLTIFLTQQQTLPTSMKIGGFALVGLLVSFYFFGPLIQALRSPVNDKDDDNPAPLGGDR